jgi:hypothetical protein
VERFGVRARLAHALDEVHALERAHVGDGAERRAGQPASSMGAGDPLVEQREDAHPQRMAHRLRVPRVVDVRDTTRAQRLCARSSDLVDSVVRCTEPTSTTPRGIDAASRTETEMRHQRSQPALQLAAGRIAGLDGARRRAVWAAAAPWNRPRALGYDGRVLLLVEVVAEGLERPPVGAPLRLEVRDTSLADVEAPLVAEKRAAVAGERSNWLQNVELEIPDASVDPRSRLTAFVHVDVDRDDAMSPGDYITTRAYPVPHDGTRTETRLQVAVAPI